MIFAEPGEGWTEDGPYGEGEARGGLTELGLVIGGDAADERDGEIGTPVREDVETEEIGEAVDDKLFEGGFFGEMTRDEGW